jgi:hypothetical protein
MTGFQWVPETMSDEDVEKARKILDQSETKFEGGANVGKPYEHLDSGGNVLGKVTKPSTRDAAIYFINDAWEEDVPRPNSRFYKSTVPLGVRNSVVEAVHRGAMCSCTGSTCSNPSDCDSRAFKWAREYVESYQKKMDGVDPPEVRVRDVESSKVYTFTPTVKPLEAPTVDEVRDGVVAKMSIKMS